MFSFLASAALAATTELPLLEASGAATGQVVAAGPFGGGVGALLSNDTVSVLGGPTPHVIQTHPHKLDLSKGRCVAAQISSQKLFVLQEHRLSSLAFDGSTPEAVDLPAPAVSSAAFDQGELVLLEGDDKPFAFVGPDEHGALVITNRTDLNVSAVPGCAWRGVGAGHGMLAAVRTGAGCGVTTDADSLGMEVRLFGADGGGGWSALADATFSSATAAPLIGVAIADLYGDGAPPLSDMVFSVSLSNETACMQESPHFECMIFKQLSPSQ